jgi:hypothetical protein
MTCSVRLGAIIVSQPSGNTMFPGFGVKKVSMSIYDLNLIYKFSEFLICCRWISACGKHVDKFNEK